MSRSSPKGIFDRSTVGQSVPAVTIEIERGQVLFFSETIGETNPIHFDKSEAQAAGYKDIVAPATYPIAISLSANKILKSRRQAALFDLINVDYRRLLHGEERYEYSGVICVGDIVEVRCRVAGFEDKKGGALELAQLETEISSAERGLLVKMTSTAVHRLA